MKIFPSFPVLAGVEWEGIEQIGSLVDQVFKLSNSGFGERPQPISGSADFKQKDSRNDPMTINNPEIENLFKISITGQYKSLFPDGIPIRKQGFLTPTIPIRTYRFYLKSPFPD